MNHPKTKVCNKCEKRKAREDFHNSRSAKDMKFPTCKSCVRERYRAYREKVGGKELYQRVKKRMEPVKKIVDDFKKDGCCIPKCEEKHPSCIDLHHVDPSEKDRNVSQLLYGGWSEKKVRAELSKCVPICSNCHRKHHAGHLKIPKYVIRKYIRGYK